MKYGFKIIDKIRKTSIVNKFNEVSEYQNYERILLAEEQKRRLSNLLLYQRGRNKFYAPLLGVFSEKQILNEPLEILSYLPVTDKNFLNEHYNEIFTRDNEKAIQRKQTGGSTGTPFRFYINAESISYIWSFVYLFWKKYADYNIGDPYCSVAGTSFYSPKRKLFYYFYHLLQNNYVIKGDIISADMDFDYKKISNAKLLFGYPSSINMLLDYYPDLFSGSKNLKAIFTTSELLLPQVRENIERKTGKKIFDMYGANDGGIVSSECHLHNGYHYSMLNCYPESIKSEALDGQHELVLTNLYNYDFPFIRYKVGDIGVIDKSPCPCGNPFDRITGLKGRTRDLVYFKNKKVFHGSIINSLLLKYPEIKLYKLIQQEDFSVDLKILVQPENRFNAVAEKLHREISSLFNELLFRIDKLSELESTDKKFKIIESRVT
ncbi:MAG: hypothetical protein R6W90_04625 [Ignavibacteriaceae bacterium]